jgi:hypothetical protein
LSLCDHDPDLAAGLEREGLAHAVEAPADRLDVVEPLDVGRQRLAARAGAGRRQLVGGGDDVIEDRGRRDGAVVRGDGLAHPRRLAVLARELRAESA